MNLLKNNNKKNKFNNQKQIKYFKNLKMINFNGQKI